jgi:hypothetical protein
MPSQCNQDKFIINNLPYKNGFWLDIGCRGPIEGSNTEKLEKEFNWSGISIDFDQDQIKLWENQRNTDNLILADATKLNYEELLKFKFNETIDYLSMDLDPPEITLAVAKMLPLNKIKFKIITFEHDDYRKESKEHNIKQQSRNLFLNAGYKLVPENILQKYFKNINLAEDWYINPKYINEIK